MKKLFILFFFFFNVAFSAINVTNVVTSIKLNTDGSASIEERISIFIDKELDAIEYNKAAEKNNLQEWRKVLNNEEVRLHVDLSKVEVIEEVKIKPQPLRNTISGFIGVIIINYKVKGLFNVEQVKPRLKIYKLNSEALSFRKTEAGNIILPEKFLLIIKIPENVKLKDINPMPTNIKKEEEIYERKEFEWKNIIMVNPRLEVIVEQSIGEEIEETIKNVASFFVKNLLTTEGLLYALLFLLLLVLYAYIFWKIRWKSAVNKE
jgi:hypothetical protein